MYIRVALKCGNKIVKVDFINVDYNNSALVEYVTNTIFYYSKMIRVRSKLRFIEGD